MTNSTEEELRICISNRHVLKTSESGVVLEAEDFLDWAQAIVRSLPVRSNVYAQGSQGGCDVLVAAITPFEANLRSLSYPFINRFATFVSLRPPLKSNGWAFARCFSPEVWIGLVLALAAVALVHYLTSAAKKSGLWSLFFVLSSALGNPPGRRSRTGAQEVLVAFWLPALTILLLCFASVLLSFLTMPDRERGPQTVDDVYRGILAGELKAVRTPVERKIYKKFLKMDDVRAREIGKDMMGRLDQTALLNGRDLAPDEVAFSSEIVLRTFFSGNRYAISTDTIRSTWFSFYFFGRLRGEIKEIVNNVIHRVWATGWLLRDEDVDNYKNAFKMPGVRKKLNITFAEDDGDIKPLSMSQLSGAFFCLVAGLCLSGLALVIEISMHRLEKRKKESNQNRKRNRKRKWCFKRLRHRFPTRAEVLPIADVLV